MNTKIVYISGAGRSGSTLLATMLGEMDGVLNIGEGRMLFNSDMQRRDLPCSCGKQIQSCPFWKDYISLIDSRAIAVATKRLKAKHLPGLVLASSMGSCQNMEWERLLSEVGTVYQNLALQTGSRLIVDSSKHPAYGYLLSQVSDLDVYVLHLIRDARGVAGSWSRPKGYLKARSVWRVSIEWIVYNLFTEMLASFCKGYLRISYEGLVTSTEKNMHDVLQLVNETADPELISTDGQESSNSLHILAGNPDKLTRRKKINIRYQGWNLPRLSCWTVTLFTWPLLLRYGYLGSNRVCNR